MLATLDALDKGEVRVAEKKDGAWKVNAWVMQAVNLYFGVSDVSRRTASGRSRRATRSR